MHDEETEIDFTQPDDLEESTGLDVQRAGNRCRKVFLWSIAIGCTLYYGVKLSNWLIGFPASLKNLEGAIFGPVALFCASGILNVFVTYLDSTMKEFRIRSRQTNHLLAQIKAQIESTEHVS